MLLVSGQNSYGSVEFAEATPQANTSCTPGYSGSEGSWTDVIASTSAATGLIFLTTVTTAVASQDAEMVLDLGLGGSGNSVDRIIAENVIISKSIDLGGRNYKFPIFIGAGTRVAARAQSSHSSGLCTFRLHLCQSPSRPESQWTGNAVETVGTITGSSGVSFTPGNATWGSYASLGTTVHQCRTWDLGVGCSNNAMTSSISYWFELAVGNGSVYDTILRMNATSNNSERILWYAGYGQGAVPYDVPAGATLYVRGWASAAPDTGWNAAAYGTY